MQLPFLFHQRSNPAEQGGEEDVGDSAPNGEIEVKEDAVEDEACSPEDEVARG